MKFASKVSASIAIMSIVSTPSMAADRTRHTFRTLAGNSDTEESRSNIDSSKGSIGKSGKRGKSSTTSSRNDETPSSFPSDIPSDAPSVVPSAFPSDVPSAAPSALPSASFVPTISEQPSAVPSNSAAPSSSSIPSGSPSSVPTCGKGKGGTKIRGSTKSSSSSSTKSPSSHSKPNKSSKSSHSKSRRGLELATSEISQTSRDDLDCSSEDEDSVEEVAPNATLFTEPLLNAARTQQASAPASASSAKSTSLEAILLCVVGLGFAVLAL